MRTRHVTTVVTGVAILAVAAGTASGAAARGKTWTVRPGGAITAKAGQTTLTDTKTGSTLKCASSSMSGTLEGGNGLPGTGIGSVTKAAYQCPTPVFSYRLTARGLPWQLNLSSFDRQTGVARGTISHVRLTFTTVDCTAVIDGTGGTTPDGVVAVSYSDATGTLKILPAGGNLHWYHVSGCDHLVADGDPASLAAAYAISPSQRITSP